MHQLHGRLRVCRGLDVGDVGDVLRGPLLQRRLELLRRLHCGTRLVLRRRLNNADGCVTLLFSCLCSGRWVAFLREDV